MAKLSKSAIYYRNNREAAAKKSKADTAYHKDRRKNGKKIKSHLSGKLITYNADLKNRQREAKKKGQDTSCTDYDHGTKKRIPKSKNRGNKSKFMFKKKKKKKSASKTAKIFYKKKK